MNSLLVMVVTFLLYIVAYNLYGKKLGHKLFELAAKNVTPAEEINDRVDYVPTNRIILTGHHFTSIAGTGPIVGPVLGVIWGWVPALLWVVLGSIFAGAVHDLGALVVSMRQRGKSIGDITGSIVNPRARTLFFAIIFFCLWIVIAIFAILMANLFATYPESAFPIWVEIPIAMGLSWYLFNRKGSLLVGSIVAIALMYLTIWIGLFIPISLSKAAWLVIIMVYIYFAATLPVHRLLQPRDYINALELGVAMVLLILGIVIAPKPIVAPAVITSPAGAPPMLPFLFITIACGAISGFHSLVSSGTSSKQIDKEPNAVTVGYGGMMLEAALATLVILAVTTGVSRETWLATYANYAKVPTLPTFAEGGARIVAALGIPKALSLNILAVFMISFAGTTIDTATRLQRYVISEFGDAAGQKWLTNRYVATLIAVVTAYLLAFRGSANVIWPLFGATNQLLAGLALLVVTVYVAKQKKPLIYTAAPMVFMIVITTWGMIGNLRNYLAAGNWLLSVIDAIVLLLEVWLIIEAWTVMTKITRGEIPHEAAKA
ncbi:MAG: carbon starvation protein A [Firmicutes bacterium]|jgi:carbon starvation protein|nr:carbon starvation protein A [Bacillota bacterium]MDH7495406.1 carbon starvation protein A [Bacillota bacterium]